MIDPSYLFTALLNLSQSIQAAQMYSENHKHFHTPLSRLYDHILRITAVLKTLHIGIIGNHFIIDEYPYLETNRMFPKRLLQELRSRGIEKISIQEGLTYGELKQFVLYLATGRERPDQRKWESITYGTIQTFDGPTLQPAVLAQSLPESHVLHGATEVLKDVMSMILQGNERPLKEEGRDIVSNVMKGLHQDDFLIPRLMELQNHDDYTVTHSLNVCAMVMAQAIHLGLPENAVREIGLAAMLHDIGKNHVPLEILKKPGKINAEEFAQIAEHPRSGANILRKIDCGSELPIIVCFEHHIRYNHTGYPAIEYRDQLNMASYMTQIADVYDALRTNRPYRSSLGAKAAVQILKDGRGTEFEPTLFDNFMDILRVAGISEFDLEEHECGTLDGVHFRCG